MSYFAGYVRILDREGRVVSSLRFKGRKQLKARLNDHTRIFKEHLESGKKVISILMDVDQTPYGELDKSIKRVAKLIEKKEREPHTTAPGEH